MGEILRCIRANTGREQVRLVTAQRLQHGTNSGEDCLKKDQVVRTEELPY